MRRRTDIGYPYVTARRSLGLIDERDFIGARRQGP
jgi:hypothetical protein